MATLYVTYDSNGGSGSYLQGPFNSGNTVTVLSNTATGITRTGYTFLEWSTAVIGGIRYSPGDTFTINANTTLYAIWSITTYTLTYLAGTGSGTYSPVVYNDGDLVTLLSNTVTGFTNPGYTFSGWTDGISTYQPGYTFTITQDIDLTAVWSQFPCFLETSKILTDQGYKEIKELKKGDLVKTLNHGFQPIVLIGKRDIVHSALEERIKDQLYQCSPNNFHEVFEPLILTGCHSILVDKFISEEQRQKTIEVNGDTYVTDGKYRLPACGDLRTSVYPVPGTYTIYHVALEHSDYYMNYGIYANGLLVETCSKRYLKELSGMELIHF